MGSSGPSQLLQLLPLLAVSVVVLKARIIILLFLLGRARISLVYRLLGQSLAMASRWGVWDISFSLVFIILLLCFPRRGTLVRGLRRSRRLTNCCCRCSHHDDDDASFPIAFSVVLRRRVVVLRAPLGKLSSWMEKKMAPLVSYIPPFLHQKNRLIIIKLCILALHRLSFLCVLTKKKKKERVVALSRAL